MNLVTGAVEETGVDKDDAILGALNAGFEVYTGAPLFIHDANLQRIRRKADGLLNPRQQINR
jgi:hypothetical protein